MMYPKIYYYLGLIILIALGNLFTRGQDAAQKPVYLIGEVTAVSSDSISVKTKDGESKASITGTTEYKKVPPDNPKLAAAVNVEFSAIEAGDKVVVSCLPAAQAGGLTARTVYLMSKSEIAQKRARENERWVTRGISGKVAEVNMAENTVSIDVSGLMGTTRVKIKPNPTAIYKRYAPNSIAYSEARESSISEIKPGDSLRAVGERSADGTEFTAEEILTGSFQTIAGIIKSIDPSKNEIVLEDQKNKKEYIVELRNFSQIKKFPEEMMQRFAQFGGGQNGGAMMIRPAGGQGQSPPPQRPAGEQPTAGGPPNGQPMRMNGPRGGIDDLYERLPAIKLEDLKIGDVIAVSSSKTAVNDKVPAIKVLAGIGPILTMLQARNAAAGSRNALGNFTIPGLEGFDFGN
jgi:hypothetical protein